MFDVGDLPVGLLTFGNCVLKAEWLSGLWNYMYVFTFFYVFFKIQKTWLFTFFSCCTRFLEHCGRSTIGCEQRRQACGVKRYLGACRLGFLGASICKIISVIHTCIWLILNDAYTLPPRPTMEKSPGGACSASSVMPRPRDATSILWAWIRPCHGRRSGSVDPVAIPPLAFCGISTLGIACEQSLYS